MSKALDMLKEFVEEPVETSIVTTNKELTLKEKWAALAKVDKQINAQFKTTNSIIKLGSRLGIIMPHFSTGLPTFDFNVTGIGGIPKGRIIEIAGPESAGKTTFALSVIAEEQRRGGLVAFIDVEHAFDTNYAAALGIDVDNLVFSQPSSGEEVIETCEALVLSRAVSIIVVDSVAAITPQAELDGDSGDSHMGLAARLMSQACRKLRGICNVNGVTILFLNQIRLNLGGYGNPEVQPGGRALKFYASLRLDVRRVSGEDGKIKSGGVDIGHRMKIKAVKNKVGPPFRQTEIDLIYGIGFDYMADRIEYAITSGVIEQKGAWMFLNGNKVSQGKANLKELLKSDANLMAEVEAGLEKARLAQKDIEL